MSSHSNSLIDCPMGDEIKAIRGELTDIKSELSLLPGAINNLSNVIKDFRESFKETIPIKMVFLMFCVLIIALAGVEGINHLFKVYLNAR